jgi:phosphotransferase system enzyme I (PtsI)
MQERPVVVRTLDVGGDKEIPYLDLGEEANPFLGWRAIRMTLDEPDFFKIQLRALLRASPGHDLRIMFPMVATLLELRGARTLLEEARQEVLEAGHDVAESIQVGIMVEIPSVAVLADRFAREVDFFSIGTNDLTQYTMAAERTNEKVAHLGDACHPAVLRQIQRVIEAAHAEGIWVGLCGELAGDADAIPILLGLGLDEFSMAPASIPRAKEIIRNWQISDAKGLLETVLNMDTAEDVRAYIRDQ